MTRYIIKRLLISLLIVFMVSVFAFSLMHILPGDPARISLGMDASEEDVQALRVKMNLDKPIVKQYWLWISGIFQGDFGDSIVYNRPVKDIIYEKLPKTLSIGIPSLIISVTLGIIFGVVCAVKRGKVIDQVLTFLTTVGIGVPQFWVGILGIYLFGMKLQVLPIQGYVAISDNFGQYIVHAILPVFCMSLSMIASVARQTRSNMLDVINQDYIRTARANGLPERSVIYKHSLRNTLIPIITIVAMQVRNVIGGSLIIENVFNIAGIGALLNVAVTNRDYLIVQTCTLFISLVTVICNLLVDILYGVVNPQIRLQGGN